MTSTAALLEALWEHAQKVKLTPEERRGFLEDLIRELEDDIKEEGEDLEHDL